MLKILLKQKETINKNIAEEKTQEDLNIFFPLQNVQRLLEFEDKIKDDESFSGAVVRYIFNLFF